LILRKIVKVVATRCHILRLKCTKINFGWVSAPDLAAGAYSTPQHPLAGIKGPTSKGRGGCREEGKGGGREGIGSEGREVKGGEEWKGREQEGMEKGRRDSPYNPSSVLQLCA